MPIEKPTCRWCERPLRKIMHWCSQTFGQFRGLPPPKIGDPVRWWDDAAAPVSPVVSLGRIKEGHMGWSMNVWLGGWGYKSGGHFCNESCAAQFAERIISDGLCTTRYKKRKEGVA